MKIEFVTRRDFNLLTELSGQLGCSYTDDTLKFPENLGDGYIKMIDLDPGLKLVIHRHKLKDELIIKRKSSGLRNNLLTIVFNTMDRPLALLQDAGKNDPIKLSSIFVTSTDIGLETQFPSGRNIHSTIIIIHSEVLMNLLEGHNDNKIIKSITSGNQSFWYDTDMTPRIHELLFQIDDPDGIKHFNHLFYRIKIQQLIYQLFVELLEKENRPFKSITASDIEKMYLIKESVVLHLNRPPVLPDLARKVCMSETKMKLLFRQIFGKSIYNYFQTARMTEAARLLKDISVHETAYKLGFLNPSYFSQLFEKYYKIRPKKFKNTL